ncbi:uncharacterized protein METZ01_LOCUS161739, partial [marine metagenome]
GVRARGPAGPVASGADRGGLQEWTPVRRRWWGPRADDLRNLDRRARRDAGQARGRPGPL